MLRVYPNLEAKGRVLSLPGYPFERVRHWFTEQDTTYAARPKLAPPDGVGSLSQKGLLDLLAKLERGEIQEDEVARVLENKHGYPLA